MTITIHPVQSQADKRAFYKLAFRIYRGNPNWVPHLWPQRRDYLDKKAAFFTYGEGEFWLAKDGDEIIGTIGTAIDHPRNRDMNWKAAYFGFFEVLPDRYDVAQAMWDHAHQWARIHGMNELIGPYSFAANDEQGFLVEGFDYFPPIMAGHNPSYYPQFAERYGFHKSELGDWVAYRIDLSTIGFDMNNSPEILRKIATRATQRHGSISVRTPKMKAWDTEIPRLYEVYNMSLAVLPEFSPIELAEFKSQAQGLREIIDPELVFIAEVEGKTVGFALGLPNITEALRHANGLQSPLDYVRFLLARRKIKSASFKIMAMDPEYWGHGLDAIMYLEMGKAMIRKGYTWVDASVTSETNPQTNKLLTRVGAYVYRRYREYRLKL
jgi:GNAT superfamily N-acetyltransferase